MSITSFNFPLAPMLDFLKRMTIGYVQKSSREHPPQTGSRWTSEERERMMTAAEVLRQELNNAVTRFVEATQQGETAIVAIPAAVDNSDPWKTEGPKGRCCICLQDTSMIDSESLLICGHSFHTTCLQTWRLSNDTCPLCRVAVIRLS